MFKYFYILILTNIEGSVVLYNYIVLLMVNDATESKNFCNKLKQLFLYLYFIIFKNYMFVNITNVG